MKLNIKSKKIHYVILSFLVGLFTGLLITVSFSAEEPAHKYLDYFHRTYQLILSNSVEKTDNKNLFMGAIEGMVGSLKDPYSTIFDQDETAAFTEEMSGEFIGIGVEISIEEGNVTVIAPIDDSPALKAGIKSGDIITKIDETDLSNKNINDVVSLIKGAKASRVKITVKRENFVQPLIFDIERAPVKVASVKSEIIEGKNIGYIKLNVFNENCYSEVESAVKNFTSQNIDKIILDLRGNPGGMLPKAVEISNLFLPKNTLVVTTRGREGSGIEEVYKTDKDPIYNNKLIILVDRGSASASEILSAALHDNKRSKLVGEKTFGKGSVQKVFDIDNGLALKLTVAKYYTPANISIHGKGIIPDYVVKYEDITPAEQEQLVKAQKLNIFEPFVKEHKDVSENNYKVFVELLNKNSISLSDRTSRILFKNLIYKTIKRPLYDLELDTQLNKAIEIINE